MADDELDPFIKEPELPEGELIEDLPDDVVENLEEPTPVPAPIPDPGPLLR